MAADIADSLARARREQAQAMERADTETARLIGEAIRVLEHALAGELIPGQRTSTDEPARDAR